jgi:predicted MPP superfamily phosphohydrolase
MPFMQELKARRSGLKAWPVVGIALVELLLLAAHWFIYRTWIDFWWPLGPVAALALTIALGLLAFSFVAAALLGFYFANPLVRLLYWLATVWLGLLNFFFIAACLSWLAWFALEVLRLHLNRPLLAAVLFSLAIATSLYGLVNARLIRIRRIPVQLAGLPESWRGRTALLLTDLHLGHLNGPRFSRRIVTLASSLNPDVIFIPGDLFDGSGADVKALIAPFRQLAPPCGIFFSTGNHDEFGDTARYVELLSRAGIRVLNNDKVTVDGLDIAGVDYADSGYPVRLRAILKGLHLVPGQASILLNHAPSRLPIVEQAGIGLQLSGHTHNGQLFPFTWLTRRAYGRFTYGLERFGALTVYTSSGAGSWGPPMRVGSRPEIVLLTFEQADFRATM